MFSSKRSRVIAAGVAAIAIAGGSYGIVTATSSSASATPAPPAAARLGGGSGSGGGSNARSGPAAGGTVGTVSSVSSSGFTLTTSTGQKVTIKEASSTTYEKGTSAATVSAVTTGEPVLVLGTTDSTTITAAQVIVQPPASSASNPGGQVIGYAKGKQGSSEQVGQIPADYTPGLGDARQRHGRGQGDRSRAGRLPGRRRRPGGSAGQRRVRGPLHRRQLAPPHLRQPGLPGHRRRRLAASVWTGPAQGDSRAGPCRTSSVKWHGQSGCPHGLRDAIRARAGPGPSPGPCTVILGTGRLLDAAVVAAAGVRRLGGCAVPGDLLGYCCVPWGTTRSCCCGMARRAVMRGTGV